LEELKEWLDDIGPDGLLYIKRLSANDTGLTGGHQSGLYIPKEAGAKIFPGIQRKDTKNPDHFLTAQIDSHAMPEQTVRAIYYNNRYSENVSNGRDEQRITRWNTGVESTPLQDPDNTGALCLFAFNIPGKDRNADFIKAWVCRNPVEEDLVEEVTGEVVPGDWLCDRFDRLFGGIASMMPATAVEYPIPEEWRNVFPSGESIIEFVISHYDESKLEPDKRLLSRRDHEYAVFRKIEDLHLMHRISRGFATVDEFIELANSVGNRRKSRSGISLELHLARIFAEQGLTEFGTQCVTEARKKPDFLFPSCEKYHDTSYPESRLRMLAVKTTCKDRWRQILNEADRIRNPFLFTLQEGVSVNQFNEMEREGVILVVPHQLHRKFPAEIRPRLLGLSEFIESTKSL